MIIIADKRQLWQDRYQALLMPVPASGIFRHRSLVKIQALYPEHYQRYQQACARSELVLGNIMLYQTQRDLVGLGVGGDLSKPKFIVDMAVTAFAEYRPHLSYLESCCRVLEGVLFKWGRYEGIRRVALLASDELIVPSEMRFEQDILPLITKYLQPIKELNVVIYR